MDKRSSNSVVYKNSILKQLDVKIESLLSIQHPKDSTKNIIILNSLPNLAFKKMETMSVKLGSYSAQTRVIDFPFISFYRRSIRPDKSRYSNLELRKTNYSHDFNVTELKKMNIPIIIQYQIDVWCEDLYQQNYLTMSIMPKLMTGSIGPFQLDINQKNIYFPYYCLDENFQDNSDIEMNEMVEIFRNTYILNVYGSLSANETKWLKTVREVVYQEEILTN